MIIRPATATDAAQMASLLNDIIAIGGTTAHETPFDTDKMRQEYVERPTHVCCHVADDDGVILGFQHLDGPDPDKLPAEAGWSYIATFVSPQAAGKGIGQHLFAATRQAARAAGITTIDATIRADNVPGLRYYGGLGFREFDRWVGVPLRDGTPVDRVRTSYDLGTEG